MGELYVGQNKLDEALSQFQRLETAEADPRETRIKIGLIYYEKGDFERAATEFNLVLAGDAENDRAHYYLGATYVEMKSDDKALEEFLRVPEKSELFVDAHIQAAYLYDRRDQTQKAIETVQSALKKKNDQKEIFGLLASLYRKQKDYPKAIEAMERVIGLDSKNDQAHFQLGALYDETKNKEKSIANMKKAIELNPKNAAALNYLGYTWAEMGIRLDEAESLIQRALKIEPNDGFYIDSLGWVYYQKGDYSQAVELLERAVEITVDDPTIIEHLADAYEKAGKKDRAVARYRDALKKTKEDEQIKRDPGKNPASGEKNLSPGRLPTQGAFAKLTDRAFYGVVIPVAMPLDARRLPVKSRHPPEFDLGQQPVAGWTAEKFLGILSQRDRQFQSLRSLASVYYRGPEGTQGFQEAVLVQRPDKARLETLSLLGAILIVTVNADQIAGLHPSEGVFVRGKSSKENLFRYTRYSVGASGNDPPINWGFRR